MDSNYKEFFNGKFFYSLSIILSNFFLIVEHNINTECPLVELIFLWGFFRSMAIVLLTELLNGWSKLFSSTLLISSIIINYLIRSNINKYYILLLLPLIVFDLFSVLFYCYNYDQARVLTLSKELSSSRSSTFPLNGNEVKINIPGIIEANLRNPGEQIIEMNNFNTNNNRERITKKTEIEEIKDNLPKIITVPTTSSGESIVVPFDYDISSDEFKRKIWNL